MAQVTNISRKQFLAKAQPIQVDVNGQKFIAGPKQFSTKSLGFFEGGKMTMVIDGVPVKCQVGINITVIGSKELPE